MDKIVAIIVFLLSLALAFPDLRLVGNSVMFLPGELGAGAPRLAEVLSILASLLFFIIGRVNHVVNKTLKNAKRQFLICFVIMTTFALFKPYFLAYLRSACLLPTMLFVTLLNINISDRQLASLFKIVFGVITFSAVFVVISPFVDLGVARYYIDSLDSTAQRYVGFGLSLPYQACFNLCAIPLFFYLQEKAASTSLKILLLTGLTMNIMAVILTGARTAYVIVFFLIWHYRNDWIRFMHGRTLFFVILATIIALFYAGDALINVLANRHGSSLAERDVVWLIGIMLIATHPIFGIQNFFVDGRRFGNVVAHVQNGFFEMIFWGGIFSLFFYLMSFRNFYMVMRKDSDLNKCFIGLILIYMIFMITEILFYSVQNYFLFMLLWGLLIANYQTRQRSDVKRL